MRAASILISFVLLFSFSCSKEDENCYLNLCIDWEEYSSQSIINNNTEWKAQNVWFSDLNNGKTIINMDFSNDFGELREKIRIRDFELTVGTVYLMAAWGIWTPDFFEQTAHFDTFAADGDASTEFYDLYHQEGFENYLKINSISGDSLEIDGEYQLYFVISQDSPSKFDESRPDTLVFTDGTFTARKLE